MRKTRTKKPEAKKKELIDYEALAQQQREKRLTDFAEELKALCAKRGFVIQPIVMIGQQSVRVEQLINLPCGWQIAVK